MTVTNGTRSWTTTSSAPGGLLADGGYLFDSLEPGTYSITVTGAGVLQRTGMVTVQPGRTEHLDFALKAER